MKVVQKSYLEVEKDGKLIELVVPADMSLGLIFDALMEMKSWVVTRMTTAHESEVKEADEMMGSPKEAATEVTEATEE